MGQNTPRKHPRPNQALMKTKEWARAWKYALGSFHDTKTKKYDNIVATIRTSILLAYLVTNCFIVAGVIRHWNDNERTREAPIGATTNRKHR